MEKLENIKVGDKVILISRGLKKVCKVDRLTKTQIVASRIRFHRTNGFSVGSHGYYKCFIRKATDKEIKEVEEINKRDMLISNIKGYPLEKLSTEELEKVYELINK